MENQYARISDAVLMITPEHFAFNPQTYESNGFQADQAIDENAGLTDEQIKKRRIEIRRAALVEAAAMASRLEEADIHVIVLPARKDVDTPDEVFPNNWVSFHEDGMMVLYPMAAHNRRLERQPEATEQKFAEEGFKVVSTLDLTRYENQDQFLEGTGSMVLDRKSKVAYACLSPRTDEQLFRYYCVLLGYTPVLFNAYNDKGEQIYHTNVMMAIGDGLSVICSESITDEAQRSHVLEMLKQANLEVLDITQEQLNAYCGNVLQVKDKRGNAKWIMSQSAFDAFTEAQKAQLEKYGEIITCDIGTIETNGGGSARCMLAEVFLPKSE